MAGHAKLKLIMTECSKTQIVAKTSRNNIIGTSVLPICHNDNLKVFGCTIDISMVLYISVILKFK